MILPTVSAFSGDALNKGFREVDWSIAVAVAQFLKEASIRDQNFEQACVFREAEAAARGQGELIRIGPHPKVKPKTKKRGKQAANTPPLRIRRRRRAMTVALKVKGVGA